MHASVPRVRSLLDEALCRAGRDLPGPPGGETSPHPARLRPAAAPRA